MKLSGLDRRCSKSYIRLTNAGVNLHRRTAGRRRCGIRRCDGEGFGESVGSAAGIGKCGGVAEANIGGGAVDVENAGIGFGVVFGKYCICSSGSSMVGFDNEVVDGEIA